MAYISIAHVPDVVIPIVYSAWKSGPKTGKKPRPDRDQTALGPQIVRTGKDRNRGPVFGPSQFLKFEDRKKTGLTSLNWSLQPQRQAMLRSEFPLIKCI